MQEIYEILRLAKDYIVFGIVTVVAAAVLFFLGYFLVYKKLLKGTKKLKPFHTILFAVFICYIIVVAGATMLSRGAVYGGAYHLQLFYSYKEAWNSFSFSEWRNIILNILMLVPFGFLLPVLFKKLRVFWKTYICGFAFALMIELVQFIFKLGIFEADDLFNNLLGTMIGYGLFSAVYAVYRKVKKQDVKVLPVILQQVPFVLTAVMFCVIFTLYSSQELGNLSSNYIYALPESEFSVSSQIDFSQDNTSKTVYSTQIYSREEVKQLAQNIFNNFSSDIDDERTMYYESTAFFYDDAEHSVLITYNGGEIKYTDFSLFENTELNSKALQSEIEQALKNLGIEVPDGLIFSNEGEGEYLLAADELIIDEYLYDGEIGLTYCTDGKIGSLQSSLVKYQPYKEYNLISQQQAYEHLADGKFKSYIQGQKDIVVKDIALSYELDSKGYYQPVYDFSVTINGKETVITIPAINI